MGNTGKMSELFGKIHGYIENTPEKIVFHPWRMEEMLPGGSWT
jgi:hypothetical protein